MNIYRLGKLLHANHKRNKDDATSPTSNAVVLGGYCHFPTTFTVHYGGQSDDKLIKYYYLRAIDEPVPFLACTAHGGWSKKALTLHSSIDIKSVALAIVRRDNVRDKFDSIILPTAPNLGGGTRTERLDWRSDSKEEIRSFQILVGRNSDVHFEDFEWRRQFKQRNPIVRELVRGPSSMGGGEVVAIWTGSRRGENKDGIRGEFQFFGSAASGELGEYCELMIVTSLLRICQIDWAIATTAAGMVEGGARLAMAGVSYGIGHSA